MKRKGPIPPKSDNPETGSPETGEPVFLAVGKLRRPHGIQGEIVMDVLTDFPERLRPGKKVYVGVNHEVLTLKTVRAMDQAMLVTFEGIADSGQAGRLRNHMVFIRGEQLPSLPEGEYYHHQLLGLKVMDAAGKELGFLSEILETGANDVYVVVHPDGNETLVPAIPGVVEDVNLDEKLMRVNLPEWS